MSLDDLAQTLSGDPRYVYLILLILMFAGTMAPLEIPVVADPLVVGAYDAIEGLGPGDVVVINFKCGAANERGDAPGIEVTVRHIIQKMMEEDVRVIIYSTSASGPYFGDITTEQILGTNYPDTKDLPYYGTKLVEYGYIPGHYTANLYALAEDFRSIFVADRYGTPTEDIPMMADILGGADLDLWLHCCTGGSPGTTEDIIGSLHEPYGTLIVDAGEQEIITMLVSYFVVGKIAGILYGSGAARQYEVVSGIHSTANPATGYQTALFYVGILVILGVVAVNLYQLWYKKQQGG
jgi:hypothetical protein